MTGSGNAISTNSLHNSLHNSLNRMVPGKHLNPLTANEIRLRLEAGQGNKAIIKATKVNRKTVTRMRLNLDLFGELYSPEWTYKKLGRRRTFTHDQEQFILSYLYDQPTAYLDELQ
jgi:hypothetical protein